MVRGSLRSLLSLLLALVSFTVHAQVPVVGVVEDPSGAAIATARVTLDRATTRTDSRGQFRFDSIAPGNHHIRVTAGGSFDRLDTDIEVKPGMTPLILKLPLAAIQEQVEVTENDVRPTIDTSANLDTTRIESSTLDKLPILNNDVIASVTPFLDATAVATGGPAIIVDGVEVRNLGVTKSDIQEININDDPYSAMWSRPGRGRIEIITKNDTKAVHGAANFAFRNSALDSTNYFAAEKPPESRRMFEISIRGPLGSDGRSSFFLSASDDKDDSAAIVRAVMPSGPFIESVSAPFTRAKFATRVSRDFSDRDHVSLEYNWRMDTWRNRGAGGLTLAVAAVNGRSREDEATFNDQRLSSSTTLNQFSAGYERGFAPTHSIVDEPAIVVQGAFIGGGAQVSAFRTEHNYKFSDIVTLSRASHVVKFGVQVPNISHRQWADETNQGGTFSFASLADYIAGRPYAYTIQQGTGRRFFYWKEFGGFAEDQAKINPRLEVSFGLRYDWTNYLQDHNNFSPRLSMAWAPSMAAQTIVRAGAGIFYDRTGVGPIAALLLHDGTLLRSYQILNPSYPDPLAGGVSFSDVPTSIIELAPNFQLAHSLLYSASVEREITKAATVVLGYRGSRERHRFRSVDINAPLPPDHTTVPNPAFGRIQEFRSDGRQTSDALELTLKAHAGKRFRVQAQYTFSHTNNNTGGIYWFPADQYAPPDAEWGRADFDQRHRLNVLSTVTVGHWIDLGLSAHYYSGSPYSETAGADLFHTGLSNARPTGVGRNTQQGSAYESIDLRWAHDVSLSQVKGDARVVTIAVDAFNILNHANFAGFVGNVRSPLFGLPTTASAGRLIQLSAEMKF